MEPMIRLAECRVKLEIEDKPQEQIQAGYKWLKNIYDNEFEQVRKVRALLPEDIWKQYQHMDCEDFREVRMLVGALSELRKRINRGRPDYFKKGKHGKTAKSQTK